jgi:tetratricopeptide (TPR) repeat protein
VGTSLINEATALIELRRYDSAEEDLTRAATVLITAKGDDHPDLIAVYTDLGAALRHQGRYPEADASLRRAVAIAQKRLPPNHPWQSQVWNEVAENELKQRHWRPAAEAYARALTVDAARGARAADTAGSKFGLAQALMKLRRDPTRAVSLANEALAAARQAPLPDEGPSAEEIERWLHAHARIVQGR